MDPLTIAVCIGVGVYVFDYSTKNVQFKDLRKSMSNALAGHNTQPTIKSQKKHKSPTIK